MEEAKILWVTELPLTINTNQIPGLITWFNGFIGFRDIQKRIERVEAKLQDIGFDVPALNRRYYFHSTYKSLVIRNRTYGRIDVKNPNNNRALTLIGAVREFSTQLNSKQQERLRARIIGSLDPDRDIREFEHEMRAFVHYKGAGLSVIPSDGDNDGRFDFLVKGSKGEFELECKTFSESIGNAISIDDSIHVFRAFKRTLHQQSNFRESGIITLTFPKRPEMSEGQVATVITGFLSGASGAIERDNYSITFERRSDWEALLQNKMREAVVNDIASRFDEHNSHSMVTLSKDHAVMFVIRSRRASRPATSIFDRLKKASEQFSKMRPAVVWGHFLGFGEIEFKELLEGQKLGQRALDAFGHYLFKSPNRSYVCRLRLSADGDSFRPTHQFSPSLVLPKGISGGGPAYDLTSNVSKFDPMVTQ
ncbi:hypothetical protein V1279_000734 [Bradyrhizobium sp. AZCC 1610]|uniref:hypothetical protein n=1 Tax=Bradyrhizobium sp. AZCC 1610 TaxID=3117020 RepID=UPI002FF3C464